MTGEYLAAGVAILVAIISLLGTIYANRQNARVNRQLEALKLQGEKDQATQGLKDEYFKATIGGMGELIKSIQRMKDHAQLILTAAEEALYSDVALQNVAKARDQFFQSFEQQLPHLKKHDFRESHRMKNIMLSFENYLRSALDGKKFVSELNETERSELQLLRDDMTEVQNMLRDSRADMLAGRLGDP